VLASWLEAKRTPEELTKIRAQLRAAVAEGDRQHASAPNRARRVVCPLLAGGQCSVYEMRPAACAGRNSDDAHPCQAYAEGNDEATCTVEPLRFFSARAVSEAAAAAVADRGGPAFDQDGNGRISFVRDIITESKVISLFITADDHACSSGNIINNDTDIAVDNLINSFKPIVTIEHSLRIKTSETRNRTVVSIENCIKKIMGDNSAVVKADGPSSNGTVNVSAVCSGSPIELKVSLDADKKISLIQSDKLYSVLNLTFSKYLNTIFNQVLDFQAPTNENSIYAIMQNGEYKFRTILYTNFKTTSAYIALQSSGSSDPEIIAWTPPSVISYIAGKSYSSVGYEMIKFEVSKEDPFKIAILLKSKKTGEIKTEQKRIIFDPDTMTFRLE
jgi:hypothetical protein